MREIKFRFWNPDRERMIYWPKADSVAALTPDTLNPKDGDTMKVMQYTGLKDKNGKEVYEGDILGINDDRPVLTTRYKVFYERGQWICQDEEMNWTNLPDMEHCGDSLLFLKVVGNIYENPELLNKPTEIESDSK